MNTRRAGAPAPGTKAEVLGVYWLTRPQKQNPAAVSA